MLMLKVDRNSPIPVFKQITDTVVRLVDSGALGAGDRLPPSRVLARTAGVHRSTVTRAYEELWALGYLESRPGSYSTMRRTLREHLPARGVEWTEPTGGYTLWLEVNGGSRNERSLHDRFLRDGVKVSCGSPFFPRPPAKPHFRLSIACLDEAQIREGCQRLGRSLSSQLET